MRRLLVAGMVSTLALGAAEAQAATVYTNWVDHVGQVPRFLAANGETNDLRMTLVSDSAGLRTRFEDPGAILIHPLTADYLQNNQEVAWLEGTLRYCQYAVVNATCRHDRAVVASLGDGDDRATVVNAGEFTVNGEAGDDTAVSADGRGFSFFGGPGADTLSGGGTMFYPAEPGVSADMHIDLDGIADDGRAGEGDNLHPDVRGVRIRLDGNHTVVGSHGDNYIETLADRGHVTFTGLAGDDSLHAWNGDDHVSGGAGADNLTGGFGSDTLIGGPGKDNFSGGPGDDILDARDGEADGNISCQSGVDTAYVDAVDTLIHECENVIVG